MKITEKLLKDLNYLNSSELKKVCHHFNIPYKICYKLEGKIKKTSELDRKKIVLERIRYFLKTKKVKKETIFSEKVLNFSPLTTQIKESDKVYHGQYKNRDPKISRIMSKLTEKEFSFGALAQETIRDFWTSGKAPTYKAFAKAWLKAKKEHKKPNEEWAYLTDKNKGIDLKDWKEKRKKIAEETLKKLLK